MQLLVQTALRSALFVLVPLGFLARVSGSRDTEEAQDDRFSVPS